MNCCRISDTRGSYFPLGVMSETTLRAEFNKKGFWDQEDGMLLLVNDDDEIVGEIEYFPIIHYLQGYEISYQLFGSQHAGKGYTTEAVNLLVQYLFGRKRVNRMQLNIHPAEATLKEESREVWIHIRGSDAWLLVSPGPLSRPGDLVASPRRSRRLAQPIQPPITGWVCRMR